MKKMGGFIIFFFILYIIYHDISIGTLPVAKGENNIVEEQAVEVAAEEVSPSFPYQEVEIKAGDTLLSLVESLNDGNSSNRSISSIINDFEELNPGVKANSLKIGQVYKIPTY
ncbi:LysM peptidoglycan-binding domain-containing protein [Litchfieldia alkalitelluris]|uniref:LysM peptidoglycan-binding domain-containing protein n=1 Tax=Litchfieldia alkalitelluris TaxID=304268 RepID=UPI00099778B5|nr:LysM domain-containing protein [Litchfieldia alkalitelluris]